MPDNIDNTNLTNSFNTEMSKLDLSSFKVKDLRRGSIKIKINHSRIIQLIENRKLLKLLKPKFEILKLKTAKIPYVVLPRGGRTEIKVTINNNNYIGVALCSNDDNFCYKRGTGIALGKLIKVINN